MLPVAFLHGYNKGSIMTNAFTISRQVFYPKICEINRILYWFETFEDLIGIEDVII